MNQRSSKISRRTFLGTAAGAAAAGLVPTTGCSSEAPAPPGPATSRVVLVRRPEVVRDDGSLDAELLHRMLNEAVAALVAGDSARAAWRQLFSPEDVVGIKTNEWSKLRTPAALEEAIRTELIAAGVPTEAVAVADRGIHANPHFQRASALVNVRPMRTHHWSGLGTCLKNLITFSPRPSEYHGDTCASLGALWQLPQVKDKVRLNILVMLTPQFHGIGPHSFSPRFVWPYGGLLVGTEPVPVDATGARIIQAKRSLFFGEDKPISPPPHHIEVAGARYGLGPSDPAAIDLVRIGRMEEALI